jgi:hypothetical protein
VGFRECFDLCLNIENVDDDASSSDVDVCLALVLEREEVPIVWRLK